MVQILFDVGNTNIKMGLAKAGRLTAVYSLPSDVRTSPDLLGVQLLRFLEHAGLGDAPLAGAPFSNAPSSSALACSVVPGLNALLGEACARYLKTTLTFTPEDVPIPLENRYARPAEVGADRLVGAFAARRLCPEAENLICVDYGTATTFDCVRGDVYLGGVICPGVNSSAQALALRTAKLPLISLEVADAEPSFGQDTATSLNHGFVFGFAAMTEGLVARLKKRLGGEAKVIATGGFAADLARVADCFDLVRPDLLMEGLAALAGRD